MVPARPANYAGMDGLPTRQPDILIVAYRSSSQAKVRFFLASPSTSNAILSDLHILVVDDQQTMRKIIRQFLRQQNMANSYEAANGIEALEFVANIHEPNPDVVICDLHMDGMDGMEFVHRMRRKKDMTPILILTGDQDKFLLDVTEQAGATRILSKPISAEHLAKEIQSAVGFG